MSRAVADRPNCNVEAADLIRAYRTFTNNPHPMLFWHEGQLRAASGAIAEALPLMEKARPLASTIPGWNELVDATIAFLRNNRTAFDSSKAAMAAVPRAQFAAAVEKMGRCFGMPYMQALMCEK